jgi:hypothetical protein
VLGSIELLSPAGAIHLLMEADSSMALGQVMVIAVAASRTPVSRYDGPISLVTAPSNAI